MTVASFLVCRVGGQLCGLPLTHVSETMRPLAVTALADAPDFVTGLAIIRGEMVPVVDLARCLGSVEPAPGRFVTVRAGGRRVALAVASVLGVRALELDALPPVAGSGELVAGLSSMDAELLLVLETLRIVSEDVWNAVDDQARP